MSADRFGLEDKIYNAWQTSKDIEAIFNSLCDGTIDQNTAENGLLGLKVIHDIRMEELWDMFTQVFQLGAYSPAQWEAVFGKPLDEEKDQYSPFNPLDYIKTKEDLDEYVKACQEQGREFE